MKNINNISLLSQSQLHRSPSQQLVCEAELLCVNKNVI